MVSATRKALVQQITKAGTIIPEVIASESVMERRTKVGFYRILLDYVTHCLKQCALLMLHIFKGEYMGIAGMSTKVIITRLT